MFTFLGTSAGEQYPGVWCQCLNCHQARKLGGRNIRRNSCAILGEETLLDFGPSIPIQIENHGFSLLNVDTLLITHGHEDHFMPWYLRWRFYPAGISDPPKGSEMGPTFTRPKPLTLFGNSRVNDMAWKIIKGDPHSHHLELVTLKTFETVQTEHLVCTPIRANHDFSQECFNFILQYKNSTILYATDTASFLPESKEFLLNYKFDLVVMEGTLGFNRAYDESVPGHSNFHLNRETREWMLRENLLKQDAVFAITHTGPHFSPPHEECAPLLEEWGLLLAFDGLSLPLK